MEEIAVIARRRTTLGKQVKQLRRQGLIPAIVYGHRTQPLPLELEERALEPALQAAGGSQLISLMVEGEGRPRLVIAKEIQRDAVTRSLLHLDLQEVLMDEAIVVEVPLSFVGESLPITERTGILSQSMGTLTVRCLPSDLVQEIEVDLSRLTQVHDAISVADLGVPPGLEILVDETGVVAQVLPLAEELREEEEVEEEVEILLQPSEEEEEGG